MANIITIGEILVEVMAKEVGQRFDQTGQFVGPFPSGAPAIFIDQVGKCGSNSMIISAVGNDGFGKINLERLKENGVNTSKIKVLDDATTGVAFVTYQANGDRDFIFHISNAACGSVDESFVDEEDFRDCKYYHIMGSSIYNEGIYRAILKGMELAKKHGSIITFDPNVRKEIVNNDQKRNMLLDILQQAHIILAGENEIFYLTSEEDEKTSINNLFKNNAELVIIKRGIRGATLYTKDSIINVDAYEVEEIDPTGAGDCFGGTFISCLNQGIQASEAVQLASIAGAMAVTKKGPMEGSQPLSELKRLYQEWHK